MLSEEPDYINHVSPNKWLAAGEPKLSHAKSVKASCELEDVFNGEISVLREPIVFRFGHAVSAAQVTTVGQ